MTAMRGHNEGSLFLRHRDQRWVAMVTMPDGKRRSRSCPHHDHRANERRPCEAGVDNLKELLRHRDEGTKDPVRLRVGPYLARWTGSVRGLAPSTMRQHKMIVRRHLIPALGSRLLTQLTPSDVDSYLDTARGVRTGKPLDAQTKRHHRSTLRRALADAVRDGLLTRNVAALSKPPSMDKAERVWLTAEQARAVITEARDERLWPLWVLILTTGLRVSEALGLSWSDVDAGTIRVRKQLARVDGGWAPRRLKTRKSRRTIALLPEAIDALAEQRQRQDAEREAAGVPKPIDSYVFLTPTGQPVHSTNILPDWYRVCRRLGLPRVTTHDLRHSAASIMLEAGVPIPVIANILGHSSVRVTSDLYAHVSPELRQDAARKMHEALR